MAERNKQITKVAQKCERQPAKHRKRKAVAPSNAAEIAPPTAGNEGKQHQSGPNEAVQRKDKGRHADIDAMAGGDETERPAQRRPGAASHADRFRMLYRR